MVISILKDIIVSVVPNGPHTERQKGFLRG